MHSTDLRVARSPAAAAELLGATDWMRAPFCTFSALATWSVATCTATRHCFQHARVCGICASWTCDKGLRETGHNKGSVHGMQETEQGFRCSPDMRWQGQRPKSHVVQTLPPHLDP